MKRHNTYINSVILQDFRAFYRTLLLLKGRAFQATPSPSADVLSTADSPTDGTAGTTKADNDVKKDTQPLPQKDTPPSTVSEIRRELETVLTNQYKELGSSRGGYAARYYEEAQYIMVALADETFINLNWWGKEEWEDNLLESLMYNTQDAGDKFFENLDAFLEKPHASQTTDMAALYLIALGLGFKGRYKDSGYESTLSKYKERLYRYIASEDTELLHNQSRLFPLAYDQIISDRQSPMMPNIRAWWVSLGVLAGGYLLFSSVIWLHHMNRFSPLVDALQKWSEV